MEPFIGMRAVIKAHETANLKIDVKACLFKHMVTKQSLLLLNEVFTCKHSLTRRIDSSPSITNKRNSVLHALLTCIC